MEEKDGKGLEQSVLQLCCAEGGAAGGPEAGQIQMHGAGLLQDGGKVHHIVELTEINGAIIAVVATQAHYIPRFSGSFN